MSGWHASDVFPLPSDDKPKGIYALENWNMRNLVLLFLFLLFFF